MYDVIEVYCQDIFVLLKCFFFDYKWMEEKIDVVICEKYGLFFVMSTLVKYVDFIMLVIECCDFGFDDGFFWFVLEGISVIEMFNVILLVLGYVYGMFMECFNDLLELCKCV